MTSDIFSIPVRVYIEDTDAGGIVYYVNYLKFMERSRTEFLRQYGYDKPAILDDGKLLVVHRAEVDYKRSARLDDLLSVTTEIEKLARTNVVFRQRILKGNELMCAGLIRIACIAPETMKPCAMPAAMREQLATNTITDKS
ncbi:tol-pal system-associated acyl-CoA thioesterase [Gilvimarinus agarilyticus]|uniref:tol-pal system-associated acyl-CoA thioesterase n=1 Tax=unclassified Gilvimarinus TaxID=2642066 RepID=UPI001C090114|nr:MULTISPECIES: tol-pal system-associated acyl-CoA thioesterase [unclassified Gilvimarinus]MBU2887381.1 tol-pal system-associated acyl-CoA thioesterase [Gilvimarinus agarilyticus]MDO6572040.1 tol-pal system-associated acyl-CoA thioesterase [Gilvimarinus sp. 2_MG-2023]MDO6746100.1 tol-pal system-associated acyl-CoA thioesterase [Gilvimarinus sp. 1_MG-2023]